LNIDRDTLLVRMEPEMTRWFAAPETEVMAAWRMRSDTLGRLVRVELPGEKFEGIAEDLASDGSLIVAGRVVAAGGVVPRSPAGYPGVTPRAASAAPWTAWRHCRNSPPRSRGSTRRSRGRGRARPGSGCARRGA